MICIVSINLHRTSFSSHRTSFSSRFPHLHRLKRNPSRKHSVVFKHIGCQLFLIVNTTCYNNQAKFQIHFFFYYYLHICPSVVCSSSSASGKTTPTTTPSTSSTSLFRFFLVFKLFLFRFWTVFVIFCCNWVIALHEFILNISFHISS